MTGDPYRTLRIADGRQTKSANLAMEQNNRGKKSLALDLKHEEGRELLLKLVETADIFVTSLRPAALERLSLGVEELRARNPRLIYVRGNGLGFRGEEANRPGYDASVFWARGGFAQVLTPPGPTADSSAARARRSYRCDEHCFRHGRSTLQSRAHGQGSLVEISLLSSAMWTLSADVALSQALTTPNSRASPVRVATR